eukprot:TRINITY_DN4231_c0_g2_i3.p2 TRINITY_DN4231_c0_g2~~TRINITY_DN4231_c0_g2_i3.p2  ORF type:complete len:101 (-),score=24.76 TRINITY_DN4231_c0_g2_i3:44-346(-)
MTLKEMGEDVIRYADERNISKFTILGHSTGGKVAMVISALHPDRINGIIVIDAPPKDAQREPGYVTKTVGLVSCWLSVDAEIGEVCGNRREDESGYHERA